MNKKNLIIAPHHDDEVIGCGGTILQRAQKGDEISVVYITNGWSGIPHIKSKQKAIKVREKEAIKASKILGIKSLFFLREEDRNFSLNGRIVKKLIKIIRQINPQIIYVPHQKEKDYDHKITYEITKEAFLLSKTLYFPSLGKPAKLLKFLYLYEVWTPMEKFILKEDITKVINKKMEALSQYKSQLRYLNLKDAVYGLNLFRGSMGHKERKFAEVFDIERI